MARLGPAGLFEEARRRRVFHVAAVYIVGAFVALQVADLAFPGMSVPETAIQFVWIGAIIGFPFALFFGWRFDLIEGRILLTAAPGEAAQAIGKADKITLSAMSMLLLAMIVGLGLEIANTREDDATAIRTAEVPPNSVAVLPFANFGGASENEFIADGITDTLLHALAQLPGLQVTARTSTFFYKGQGMDIREIAAQLGVRNVLEGSVQFSGNRIRVVAQLIEAETGFHLWSNTYDEEMDDIFGVQDSIASNVAVAMHVTLADDDSGAKVSSVSTSNLEAYLKYLEGLEQSRRSSNISLPLAEKLYVEALAMDPEFTEVRRELVYTYYMMEGNATLPRAEARARAGPVLARLLKDDPGDGLAIAISAQAAGLDTIDVDELIARLIVAIGRRPGDAPVYVELHHALWFAGRREEAIDWLNRALKIDPLDHQLYWWLGFKSHILGDLERAIDAFEQATRINPEWPSAHTGLADALWTNGDYVGWYREYSEARRLDPLDPDIANDLSYGLIQLGLFDEADAALQRALEIGSNYGNVMGSLSARTLVKDPVAARSLTEDHLRKAPLARGGGHLLQAIVYVSASVVTGNQQDALAVLEDILPGVSSGDFVPATRDEFYVHFWTTLLWAEGRETGEIDARLERVAVGWDAMRPGWREISFYAIPIATIRGDLDAAASMTLEYLGDRVHRLERFRYWYPYTVVASEPAVAERLAVLEEELRIGREAVQAYIQQNK